MVQKIYRENSEIDEILLHTHEREREREKYFNGIFNGKIRK